MFSCLYGFTQVDVILLILELCFVSLDSTVLINPCPVPENATRKLRIFLLIKIFFLDSMDMSSKLNHHRSFLILGFLLWVLIAILHSSLVVKIHLDCKLSDLIIQQGNGYESKTIRFQMVIGK